MSNVPSIPRTTRLRRLLADGCLVLPGVANAYTARQVERAGFDAVYVSGAGLCNVTAGVPDVGLLGLDEWTRLVGYVCDAVRVPVVADADTGFGGPSNAARAVRELTRVGLAGLHVEDQEFPKRCGHLAGKSVVPTREMVAKLRAMSEARTDPDFLLIARTDARAVEGLDAAIDRAHAYLDAGADAVFPEALADAGEFAGFAEALSARQVPLLANMTEFGQGPLLDVSTLAGMGYRMVIFPQTLFRISARATQAALEHLKREGTQVNLVDRMQSRPDLYAVLDYDPQAEVWTP